MESERESPRPRIRWDEVRAYAERFEEYRIIRAVDSLSRGRHQELGSRGAAVRGQRLDRFGPLRSGASLSSGWEIAELALANDSLEVRARAAGAGQEVVFCVAGPGAGPDGPFEAAPLHVHYRTTEAPFASFAAAGEALTSALLEGADTEARWREWLESAARSLRTARPSARRLADAEELELRADGKVYLRITDACQERCTFCFFYESEQVDNLVRERELEEVIAHLDPTAVQQIVLTGGEPTLHPKLPEYVALLVERGFRQVVLQTNGIKLAEDGYLERLLPYRDRLGIGFSIHAATARTNDALTTISSGFFDAKRRAVRRAVELGFHVKITLVLSRYNLPELGAFMEMCSELLAGSDGFLQLSLPSFEGRMLRFLDTYPRLHEIAELAPPALRRATALGLRVAFCHQCQVPPCVLPDDAKHLESLWFCETPSMWEHDRAYGPGCSGCAARSHCSGLWAGYAQHFGTDELRPFAPGEVELPATRRRDG